MIYLFFAIGLILIIKGGDVFVDAASWMAKAFGLPEFLVGATIVSIATTLPELFVSVLAASAGQVEMAVSNAVGSATANLGLILAVSVIFAPQAAPRKLFGAKAALLFLSLALVLAFSVAGSIGIIQSAVLVAVFLLSLMENAVSLKGENQKNTEKTGINGREGFINAVKFILGAGGIILGADLLVDNGILIAQAFSIPESVIGATVIAVGTSVPELVTAVSALRKGSAQMSVGNIFGANIIDVTLILPICSFVSGAALPVQGQNLLLDIPACLLLCIIAALPIIIKQRLTRFQGLALLGIYIAYLAMVLL